MSLPSVKVVHNWRNKPNKSGLYSIHLPITIAGEQKYYPVQVPMKVSLNQWSGEADAWVKNNHPFFFEINNKIRERKNVILDLIGRYYNSTNALTFAIIFKELKKSINTDSFNEYFEYYINHPSGNLQLDTLKKYKACLDHLNRFNKKIRFVDLSPELVRDFYDYCRSNEHLAGSTIDSYFDSFRKIVRLARRSHYISKEHE